MISFSGEQREIIEKSILFHLRTFGIPYWYDSEHMFTGDDIDQSIINGINSSDYSIVLLSKDFIKNDWAMKELDLIKTRYYTGNIHKIFPILYEIKKTDLPENLSWIKSMIYERVHKSDNTLHPCCRIVESYYDDIISRMGVPSFFRLIDDLYSSDSYIMNIIESYFSISESQYELRLPYLNAIYTYVCKPCKYENNVIKSMIRLQNNGMPISRIEVSIAEKALSISIFERNCSL